MQVDPIGFVILVAVVGALGIAVGYWCFRMDDRDKRNGR